MSALKKTPGYINVGTLWFERFMGLLVLANLLFVTFDWSYVKLRPFYLRSDLLIENNLRERQAEKYVKKVQTLKDCMYSFNSVLGFAPNDIKLFKYSFSLSRVSGSWNHSSSAC